MNKTDKKFIDTIDSFDKNWKQREEAFYNHWTKGNPKNQIQLAFRNHWKLFKEILPGNRGKCLEVGCGRGSISSYFAENGYDCTLLDSSQNVLQIAQKIFRINNHQATFISGDTNALPFHDNDYDIVVSIGLLEHFDNIASPISEHIRALRPGGTFIGYIVPEKSGNIQRNFEFINRGLKRIFKFFGKSGSSDTKKEIFRSDYNSTKYLGVLESLSVTDIHVLGVYPLPMISHSVEFPFTLMPAVFESMLTTLFHIILSLRRLIYGRNPWMCSEKIGQAFLVYCRKSATS